MTYRGSRLALLATCAAGLFALCAVFGARAHAQYCAPNGPTPTIHTGDCEALLFQASFEDCDLSVWDTDDDGSGGGWGSQWWLWSDHSSPSGNLLYAGDPWSGRYANWTDTRITSRTVVLPALTDGESLDLQFRMLLQVEYGYDFFSVIVDPVGDAPEVVRAETGWRGAWESVSISLNRWAGRDVALSFRFESDYSVTHQGVRLDDIVIRHAFACCATDTDCSDGLGCSVDTCVAGRCENDLSACAGHCQPSLPNFLILTDRSGSMNDDGGDGRSKWTTTVEALNAALATYEGDILVGGKLFATPGWGSCGVSSTMDIAIGSSRADIIARMAGTRASGFTPMELALRQARAIYGDPTTHDPSKPRYVMLITDGMETCGGDPERAVLALTAEGVETFIVGFGAHIDHDVLDALAVGGGHALPSGTKYYNATNSGDLEAAFASILGQVTDEVCDGVDNDCDGAIDEREDVGTLTCTHPSCGEGIRECINGAWGACQLSVDNEICDGIDNNCNLVVDDPWVDGEGPVLGAVCVVGVGACERAGLYQCPADYVSEATCSATPGAPTVELCNSIDDDCDGAVDSAAGEPIRESCFTGYGTPGVGICQAGTRTCTDGSFGGSFGTCVGQVTAQPESCNDIDDDCDGDIDEGCPTCTPTQPTVIVVIDGSLAMLADAGAGMSAWEAVTLGMADVVATHGATAELALKLYPSLGGASCSVDGDLDVAWGEEALLSGYLAAHLPTASDSPLRPALDQCRALLDGLVDIPAGTDHLILVSTGETSCGHDADAVTLKLAELNQIGIHTGVIGFNPGRADALTQWGIAGGLADLNGPAFHLVETHQEFAAAVGALLDALSPEFCNDLDDDCNTLVDEGLTDHSCMAVCTGTLVPGSMSCSSGSYGACDPLSPSEACDDLDNNCDGTIDEAFLGGPTGLGRPCAAGVGACATEGSYVCNAGGDETTCGALPGDAQPRRCDGVDNDCDGVVDRTWTDGSFGVSLGERCAVGLGACHVVGAFVCPPGGTGPPVCDAVPPPPQVETCDGVDNDCDGLIDEDPTNPTLPLSETCFDGPAETLGVGACAAGAKRCVGGTLGRCEGQVLPGAERCDGADNDCDGATDQDEDGNLLIAECYTGPAGTVGVGRCSAGVQVCNGTHGWSVCASDVTPRPETCNRLDDDCDGVTDDAWVDGTFSAVLGAPCVSGLGECAAGGTVVCPSDGVSAPICDATPGAPSPEACNGHDDDCDGLVDEDSAGHTLSRDCFPTDGGAHGLGYCTAGTESCEMGAWGACTGAVAAVPEVCDGYDNDCDGTIDEGTDGLPLWETCYEGDPRHAGVGVCAIGIRTCADAGWGECVGDVMPGAEQCNGVDDDCDGVDDLHEPNIFGDGEVGPCELDPRCQTGTCYCVSFAGSAWECVME